MDPLFEVKVEGVGVDEGRNEAERGGTRRNEE